MVESVYHFRSVLLDDAAKKPDASNSAIKDGSAFPIVPPDQTRQTPRAGTQLWDHTREFAMTAFTAPPNLNNITLVVGDTLTVDRGGIATNTTITRGATADVNGGGLTDQTTLSGGIENVHAAGNATRTTVNSGGTLNVLANGKADVTTINDSGVVNVIGGTVDHTTINNGGELAVNSNGVSNLTTINSGGLESILAGGTSNVTTILSGGHQDVLAGGISNATTIQSGGLEHVLGLANNTSIFAGGELTILNGGTANGVAFIANTGTTHDATLELFSPTGLKGTITGWQVGDVIDFVATSVTQVVVENNNTLTVTYGSARDPQIASYLLANLQPNTHFELQSDGQGGTELILQPGVQSTVVEGEVPIIGMPVEDIGAIIAGSRINF